MFDRARQDQQRRPDALNDQPPGRNVFAVELAGFPKEQTVAGHRVISACARQNQSIITTEGRDHDRYGHYDCPAA